MISYRFRCDCPSCRTTSVQPIQVHPEGWGQLKLTVADEQERICVGTSDLCQAHVEEAKALIHKDGWLGIGGGRMHAPERPAQGQRKGLD